MPLRGTNPDEKWPDGLFHESAAKDLPALLRCEMFRYAQHDRGTQDDRWFSRRRE
jgi:hypothetical protein